MSIINVILSGGVGSRLWPLSRKECPKQYLKLFDGKSLFELTIDRNDKFIDKILVVGNLENNDLTNEGVKNSKKAVFSIIETVPRNTAPAIAYAAFFSEPDDILLVTPSDHMIDDSDAFKESVNKAISLANSNYLVTFGIKPTRPEIGYGYIEYEKENVISFREKPDGKTAKKFLDSQNFLWNSGMFCFKASVFLDELKKYQPELFQKTKKVFENSQGNLLKESLSLDVPSISIDYAVMEKSNKIKVIPSEFSWTDLGSFESLYDYLMIRGYPKDSNNNISIGTDEFVGFVGLKNTILVKTNDVILVVNKENSQEVKNLYNLVERTNCNLL